MRSDARALVAAQREELVAAVIEPCFASSGRRKPYLRRPGGGTYRYLVAQNADEEGFYLVWDGPGENRDFNEDVYEACAAEALRARLQPVYHVWSRFNLFATPGVIWSQVPGNATAGFSGPVTVHCFACRHSVTDCDPVAAHDRMEQHYQGRHGALIGRLLADDLDLVGGRRGRTSPSPG
jgi:hypothetical protein